VSDARHGIAWEQGAPITDRSGGCSVPIQGLDDIAEEILALIGEDRLIEYTVRSSWATGRRADAVNTAT
jgi:hypothetical protein